MTDRVRLGIDTGGTFTDVAVLDRARRLRTFKVPSTPADPARAVLAGVAAALQPGQLADLVHGTTVGLNAVLTGALPRTAWVTNAGFEDLIEIGRQARRDVYDLTAAKALPPVPRELRFGIASRRGADGERLAAPSAKELRALHRAVATAHVDAIAIGLLFGHRHPEDERELATALASLGVPITCSGELLPIAGEFERYSAAILNAAMAPVMGKYIARLATGVAPGRVRLMRSSGGILETDEAARYPARAAMSGPAGGVGASRALQRALRCGPVAAFDMGGTSTDVCLIGADEALAGDSGATLGGLPLPVPAVPVHTVGCGGGSLARVDAGGALRVGPESAGADPGPACYGKGREPTVTDAHVALGHIGAETLLGGGFPIDVDRSVRALEPLARRLGVSVRRAAEGILEVADNAMLRALLVITVAKAVDPATVRLVAYGGAGGLHAARLAGLLAMPEAIVPEHPGAFSAVGLALAGESNEVHQPIGAPLASLSARRRRDLATELRRRVLAGLPRTAAVTLTALVRAQGQGAALPVPLRSDLEAGFAREHLRLFGFTPAGSTLECTAVVARAEADGGTLPRARLERGLDAELRRRRPPAGGPALRVVRRGELGAGWRSDGPLIIEEATGVTVVPSGWSAEASPWGLRLRRR